MGATFSSRLSVLQNDMLQEKKERQSLRDQLAELQDAIFAEKVEQIITGAETEQEKVIAVARWISGHIGNQQDILSDEYFPSFASRVGLCGSRVRIFVKAMETLSIKAHLFNMYNFGGVGYGHSCVEAFYGGKWHFFDVTYAGYFMKDGDVLSWDEITHNPEAAIKSMVVFEDTRDRYNQYSGLKDKRSDNELIDTQERMETIYTIEAISNSVNTSGAIKEKLKVADIRFESSDFPIHLGKVDQDSSDVWREGIEKSLTENFENIFNTRVDFFHLKWHLSNMGVGKKYILTYYFTEQPTQNILNYWAKITGGTIISGEIFLDNNPQPWHIEFIANKSEVDILCGYDSREINVGPKLDAVEITMK